MAKRTKRNGDPIKSTIVECGALRFTPERVEKVRNGKRVTSFSREGVDWIRLARESPSEQPIRELLWALGAGVGSALLLQRGLDPFKLGETVAGALLGLVAVVLVVNQFRRVPVLTIRRQEGLVRVGVEGAVTPEELREISRRLQAELRWPVKQ